jgi:spoIIIJ-associated protein
MKSIESSAKTIEDAIRQGLEKLNVSLGDVTIDIIHEGTKGFFGLVGGKEAKVRLTVKESEQEDDILSTLSSCPVEDEEPVKPQAPASKQKQQNKQPEQQPRKAEPDAMPAAKPIAKEAVKPAAKEQTKSAPKEPKKPEVKEPLQTYAVVDPATAVGKAQEFLVNVTKLMNMDVSVEADADAEGNVRVNVHGDTLGILIGRRGETLDALQYLTSLNVNHGQEEYTRVTLDTENYRAKREESLMRLANRMANRAVKTGRKVVMEPMNPYERRILHSALQQNTAVTTHSEGDEPNRHVVISLK